MSKRIGPHVMITLPPELVDLMDAVVARLNLGKGRGDGRTSRSALIRDQAERAFFTDPTTAPIVADMVRGNGLSKEAKAYARSQLDGAPTK